MITRGQGNIIIALNKLTASLVIWYNISTKIKQKKVYQCSILVNTMLKATIEI